MSSRARPLLALLVALAPFTARGDGAPLLHEFVPEDPSRDVGVIGAGEEGQNPSAIRVGADVLTEPDDPTAAAEDEQTYTASGGGSPAEDVQRRHESFRPDDLTHLDSELRYTEAFNPAIAPFKRLSAFDAVRADFTLGVGRPGLEPVAVVGTQGARSDRDLFWGSIVVDFAPGQPVPIPSVSPEARVLSYRTTPEVEVRFLRDSADNFYAMANHGGNVRLVFLMDASAAYFGAELPDDRTAADLPRDQLFALPPQVAASAQRVASALGVSRTGSLRQTLSRLTAHFRAYEESATPPTGFGNLYENLALGGKGVCRHRAFAFMVTANALGIPTRFVMNEAHAFVESLMPDTGWLRIDLGGAAQGLSVQNASDRPRHEPRRADELPQPEAYRQQYSLLRGQGVSGAPPSSRGNAPGAGPLPSAPAATAAPGGAQVAVPQPSEPGSASASPDPTSLAAQRPEGPPLLASFTVVESGDRRPRRGGSMHVQGRVVDASGPLARAHVQLFLSRDGHTLPRWLGTVVSEPDGRWSGDVLLPADTEVGAYHLLAVMPGDERHAPSMSAP